MNITHSKIKKNYEADFQSATSLLNRIDWEREREREKERERERERVDRRRIYSNLEP